MAEDLSGRGALAPPAMNDDGFEDLPAGPRRAVRLSSGRPFRDPESKGASIE